MATRRVRTPNMSVYGCPDPETTEWKYGYMNISFKQHTDLYETKLGKVHRNRSDLDLLGSYGPCSFQLNFCYKANSATNDSEPDMRAWPSGQYYIYGTDNGCPQGKVTLIIEMLGMLGKSSAFRLHNWPTELLR